MLLFDTHAHLTDQLFTPDLSAVITRASSASLSAILVVSSDPADAIAAHSLSASHSSLLPAAGLHPEHVATLTSAQAADAISALRDTLTSYSFVAVGEVGLDHTPRVLASGPPSRTIEESKALQLTIFRSVLSLATHHKLPVSVHSRGAGRRALEVLSSPAAHGVPAAVLHAFDGRVVHAERALASIADDRLPRLYFSVPPSIVRSPQMQKMVSRLPLEVLLLESDSPALAVVAGERNEPAEIVRALEMIAALKGMAVEDAARVMEGTAAVVFRRVHG